MKKKIAVAMSGGVDSSFAAYLLLQEGYEVIGLNMNLPIVNSDGCFGSAQQPSFLQKKPNDDLQKVCEFLKIPFFVLDYTREFSDIVIKYFCTEYENGRTPNPCIVCNKFVKFGLLLEKAKELGADYLGTGHYANIEFDEQRNLFFIKKAADLKKDQSYFLSFLNQEQLKYIKFPIGNYKKQELRVIAENIGLPVHQKSDSQEICFVPENEYRECVQKLGCGRGFVYGDMVLADGTKVGRHNGIANFTVGQRKGLGSHAQKMYVKDILADKNVVVIGKNEELFSNRCIVENMNWVDTDFLKLGEAKNVMARIRYKSLEKPAVVKLIADNTNTVEVVFEEKQRAITSGQAIVFYIGDRVIGGGWIKSCI